MDEACAETRVTDGVLEEGVALPIARARLMIARERHTQPVEPGQDSATFTVQLDAGPTLLHTWFDDEKNQPICGAYYVGIERE